MNNLTENQFMPDYAIHPGEILEEYLETLGMSQTALFHRTGIALKHINEIIKGKAPVTPETALKLERAVGHPAHFWNNLQRLYEETQTRLADRERLDKDREWLQHIPVAKMIAHGWIKKFNDQTEQLIEVLRFFGVTSRERWQATWEHHQAATFRQSRKGTVDAEAISAWLRRGELQAQAIQCEMYDKNLFKKALAQIRPLTRQPPEIFQPGIVQLCAKAGVAVVFVPELPHTGTSGATLWLSTNKALIQLSLRYKSDDHLWFTFFHEAGHILLHGKKDVFLEEMAELDQEKEEEANRFAADFLIPPDKWQSFKHSSPTYESVQHFAEELSIAPGIVVGRLQHENIKHFSWGNQLKRRLAWKPVGSK